MDQLEEIKQKVDIVELVGEYVTLKKAGRNLTAPCPFHSENKPSFMVSPERQIFKCFGCGAGGDVFKFVTLIEGLDFGEAVRKLAEKAGVTLKKYRSTPEQDQKKKYYEVNDLAAEYYHYLLTEHSAGKKALEYILGRGISKKSLDEFKIGFAPEMWDGLQKFLVDKKKREPKLLEKAGLIIANRRGGYYDRFRGRLMFPLRDYQGNVCGFAGRVIPPAPENQAKYINTAETPVYQKSRLLYGLSVTRGQIRKQDQAVIVEGELDLISSYQAGVFNVVAIKGSALTEDQLILLKRYTKNLVLALDADFAGNKAAQRGIELADKMGFAIKVVEVQGGKDPDEAAQKDPKGWLAQIKKAVSVYDYLFHFAFTNHDERSAEGKRQIGQFLVPVLAKMTDRIVQGHYVSLLAQRLGIGEEAVVAEIEKVRLVPDKAKKAPGSFETARQSRREVLEEYFVALCLQGNRWEELVEEQNKKLVLLPAHQKIIDRVADFLKTKSKERDSQLLAQDLPAEVRELFDLLYLKNIGELEGERLAEEVQKTARQLQELDIKGRLREISHELKLAEEKREGKKIDRLNQEFRDLSAKLA